MPQFDFYEPLGIRDVSCKSGGELSIGKPDARHFYRGRQLLHKLDYAGLLASIGQGANDAPRNLALHLAGGQRPALAKWVTGLTTSPGPVSGHGIGLTVAVQTPPLSRDGAR